MANVLPKKVVDILMEMGLVEYVEKDGLSVPFDPKIHNPSEIQTRERTMADLAVSLIAKDDNGQTKEFPNPKPVEIPVGHKKPETWHDQLERVMKLRDMKVALKSQGLPTYEDFREFVDDDIEPEEFVNPLTGYQTVSVINEAAASPDTENRAVVPPETDIADNPAIDLGSMTKSELLAYVNSMPEDESSSSA